jgi:hypothetical protein
MSSMGPDAPDVRLDWAIRCIQTVLIFCRAISGMYKSACHVPPVAELQFVPSLCFFIAAVVTATTSL